MNASNSDRPLSISCVDRKLSLCGERLIELRDLISLGEIRIEIVFPREDRDWMNIATKCDCSARCKLDCLFIENRQRTRKRETDRTGVRIGSRAEISRASAERLALGFQLNVHLESDDHFICVRTHWCAS